MYNKLQLLIKSIENEVLEFKEAKKQFDFNKLGKYFSALCNEANLKNKSAAWLIFGIRDTDKKIVGSNFRNDKRKLHNLKSEIAKHTTNRITFSEIYDIQTPNGRVILFEIPPAPKGIPIAWKGHYYGRDSEELNALNMEEIERIRSQSSEEDWSAKTIEDAGIQDLSYEAVQKARNLYQSKNPHLKEEVENWDDLTLLNKLKICIRGKITRTAIILLGKPESEHLLYPATSKISWILKNRDNVEKDYEHFSCPLLLNSEKVYQKIRNLKFRYITDGTLFPEEVNQYDPYIIREGLNNCIAHQDYKLGGKINIVENEEGFLVFLNSGRFIPGSVEEVVISDAPESKYRNKFLVEAMINLKMIDAIGSGIKRMFTIQREKYFPLPDYDFRNNKVKLTVTGKVIDMNYARKLATMPELLLYKIMLLDKIVKNKPLQKEEINLLKKEKLIEGRKPNFHISASVAKVTGEKSDYIKQRGIDDNYCQRIIIDYLKKFDEGKKSDFEEILLSKLPDVLDESQKKNKIKNNLQKLRLSGIITSDGKTWKMSKKSQSN